MADVSLHFAVGLAAGTLALVVPVCRRLKPGRPLAGVFLRWLFLAYAFGVFAVFPNLLRRAGLPEGFCSGWWTLIFFGHPLIDRLEDGGKLIGQLLILGCFAIQYVLLVAAIRVRRRQGGPDR